MQVLQDLFRQLVLIFEYAIQVIQVLFQLLNIFKQEKSNESHVSRMLKERDVLEILSSSLFDIVEKKGP